MQLAENNKLNIDHPVVTYLLEFPYSSKITISQLLTHTAGIPNPLPLSWIHLAEEHDNFNSKEFFKKIFVKHYKINSKPNSKYKYSNLGYVLLGQVIEKLSGIPYEDYVRKHIIQPLNNLSELNFKISDSKYHAIGYHKKLSFSNVVLGFLLNKSKYMGKTEGKWLAFNDIYINGASYGGLIGTSNAFIKYVQELLKPNCKLLGDDLKKLLFTENSTNNGKATGMCMSWFTGQLKGVHYFTHAGGGGGYYCEIRLYPNLGIGSVLMLNRSGFSDERLLDKLDTYTIKETSK